jgi:hypothetical protein
MHGRLVLPWFTTNTCKGTDTSTQNKLTLRQSPPRALPWPPPAPGQCCLLPGRRAQGGWQRPPLRVAPDHRQLLLLHCRLLLVVVLLLLQ